MESSRVLSHAAARKFYDRIGAGQDTQAFYERPAIAALVAQMNFAAARAVVEFGCGTGRFAAELLESHLSAEARYLGLDISEKMVALTRERIVRFGDRANVILTQGDPAIPPGDGQFDRFVSTYVFDLLSDEDSRTAVREARRVLVPGGLIGLISLSHGARGFARFVSRAWERVHRISPALVGGCRPIDLSPLLEPSAWAVRYNAAMASFGITSQVIVAERLG